MGILQALSQWYKATRLQFNPYQFFVLFVQLTFAFTFACWSPLVIRTLFLPAVTEYSTPLHFAFTTCTDQLAGVCSFPTAQASLTENEVILSHDVPYDVFFQSPLYLSEAYLKFGAIQVVLEALNGSGHVTAVYRRTTFVKQIPFSIFKAPERLFFLPLIALGLSNSYPTHELKVHITDRFLGDSEAKIAMLTLQIQNRFVEVDNGVLYLRARLGFFRYCLYYWPLFSSLIIFSFSLSSTLFIIFSYWGLRNLWLYINSYSTYNPNLIVQVLNANSLQQKSGHVVSKSNSASNVKNENESPSSEEENVFFDAVLFDEQNVEAFLRRRRASLTNNCETYR